MASTMATILHFPANFHPSSSLKPFLNPNQSNSSIPFKSPKFSLSSSQSLSAKTHLLNLISDQDRGLKTQQNPNLRSQIIAAIDSLAILGKDLITTDDSLSGTWRMLWTTEKEQLFIIKNASFFGTQVGDVLQVIDVDNLKLNNVITFPPSGVFFVRSSMEVASTQRANFRFTSAVLRGKDWEFPLLNIVFNGEVCEWTVPLPRKEEDKFESVYLDDDIRVAKDIRGDYLVVDRAPYEWKE